MAYQAAGVPLVIFGGIEYGAGSSRDWAAKGTNLLGVKAVIAESFERIHRSNLVGMGVIPFEFTGGDTRKTPWPEGRRGGLDRRAGRRSEAAQPGALHHPPMPTGRRETIQIRCRIDTEIEVEYVEHGGVLHYVLRNLARG